MTHSLVEGQFIKSNIDCGQNFPGSMVEHDNRVDTIRGCLKKIDKIANSFVLGISLISGSVESRDFEQYLLWLGLNSEI